MRDHWRHKMVMLAGAWDANLTRHNSRQQWKVVWKQMLKSPFLYVGSSWTLHRSKRLLLHANVQRSCRIECLIGISSCDDQENKCITLSPNIFGKIHYDIFPNRSYNKYLPCGATRIKIMVKSHCPSRIIRLHQLEITHHSFEVTLIR